MREFIDIVRVGLIEGVITESKVVYQQMINAMPEEARSNLAHQLKFFIDYFQRYDRVVWALRWERLAWAMKNDEQFAIKIAKSMAGPGQSYHEILREAERWHEHPYKLKHLFSMERIYEIQSHIFDRDLPSRIVQEFEEVEKEWIESRKKVVGRNYDHEILIQFNDDWAWFDLGKSSCSEEGEAMGHCGNNFGKYGDTVLSLRERIDGNDEVWTPHLTFILDGDGFLGEMKARGNSRPPTRYHRFIVPLLQHDSINGIKGGGYKPETNFSVEDLDEGTMASLLEQKPALRTFGEQYAVWKPENLGEPMPEVMRQALARDLEARDLKFVEIKPDGDILVQRVKLTNYHLSVTDMLLDDYNPDNAPAPIEQAIYRQIMTDNPRLTDKEAAPLARRYLASDDVARAHRKAIPLAVDYGSEFVFDGVSASMTGESLADAKVEVVMDISDYVELIGNIDGGSETRFEEDGLAEARAGWYQSDILDGLRQDGDINPITLGFLEVVFSTKKSHEREGHIEELARAIVDHAQPSMAMSRTVSDYRQREFNFN